MKIVVENLPEDITEDGLKNIFDQIGEVRSVKLKTGLLPWEPVGQGIIDMTLEVDAYRAINCLEGAALKDKKIHVQEAYPLFEKAKTAFEHITDGYSLPELKLRSGFERWKDQIKWP